MFLFRIGAGFSLGGSIPSLSDELVGENDGESLHTDAQFAESNHYMYLKKAGRKIPENQLKRCRPYKPPPQPHCRSSPDAMECLLRVVTSK